METSRSGDVGADDRQTWRRPPERPPSIRVETTDPMNDSKRRPKTDISRAGARHHLMRPANSAALSPTPLGQTLTRLGGMRGGGKGRHSRAIMQTETAPPLRKDVLMRRHKIVPSLQSSNVSFPLSFRANMQLL
uniref:Uncharacterized protein n=1 Tax=Plectus sambesii TaxID=2011161 RepID=A0A914W371_9BILA